MQLAVSVNASLTFHLSSGTVTHHTNFPQTELELTGGGVGGGGGGALKQLLKKQKQLAT